MRVILLIIFIISVFFAGRYSIKIFVENVKTKTNSVILFISLSFVVISGIGLFWINSTPQTPAEKIEAEKEDHFIYGKTYFVNENTVTMTWWHVNQQFRDVCTNLRLEVFPSEVYLKMGGMDYDFNFRGKCLRAKYIINKEGKLQFSELLLVDTKSPGVGRDYVWSLTLEKMNAMANHLYYVLKPEQYPR